MIKTCKIENCEAVCDVGRRYCHKHFLARVAELRRIRKAEGKKFMTEYKTHCRICGVEISSYGKPGGKKEKKFCDVCRKKLNKVSKKGAYVYSGKDYKVSTLKHRVLAEALLGYKLNSDDVVHHIDFDKSNNSVHNLVVLSRADHIALHSFLNVIIVKEDKVDDISFIKTKTLDWLSKNTKKTIKLWEL